MKDDDPITLKDAAAQHGLTVATLRAEADRGNLVIFMYGRKWCTTLADLRYTAPKLLKLLTSKWRKSVNKAGNSQHICAENVPALLRVAAVQLARLDPEDRAALLPFVKRDMEACRG